MAINAAHEALYNNQLLVPEAPQIMGKVAEQSEAFRNQANAEFDIAYGERPREQVDLFLPKQDDGQVMVMFIHGGYWQMRDRKDFSILARGLVDAGLPVALPSYDLCPDVSVAEIIDQMRQCAIHLWKRFNKPLLLSGHSAGGHLTAALMATDWAALGVGDLKIIGGAAISGVFDLAPLIDTSINGALKLNAETAREVSPQFWTPTVNAPLLVYVGGGESQGFLDQSKNFADQWAKQGVDTRYREIAGKHHFDIIEGLPEADSDMVREIMELI